MDFREFLIFPNQKKHRLLRLEILGFGNQFWALNFGGNLKYEKIDEWASFSQLIPSLGLRLHLGDKEGINDFYDEVTHLIV